MTQKELLYVEDAIGHEQNMISVCNETLNCLQDASLKSFLKKELKKHKQTLERLINLLEAKCND